VFSKDIKGMKFFYELHGTGQPLVLIAGYTGDHTFWNLMLDKLVHKFQVLIFDNRAIGQTQGTNIPFTLEMMAEDTMELVNQLGLENPVILGQSMGGAIAQIIAKNYAFQIDKLIILNSAAKFSIRSIKVLNSLLNCRKENISFYLFIDAALPWFFSSDFLENPDNILAFKQALINNPHPQSVGEQERQFNALLPFDSRKWIHQISAPTMVISAIEDIIATPEDGLALAKGIPNSQFITIPGAHSSPVEQSFKVNQLIEQFAYNI
jgi:pimeloyl-ACP methyl ester carboxylesterase